MNFEGGGPSPSPDVTAGVRVLDFLGHVQDEMANRGISIEDFALKIGITADQAEALLEGDLELTARSMFLLAEGVGRILEWKFTVA